MLLLAACVRPDTPNVLVVVLDDIGVEQLSSWDVPHAERPSTPVLDGLAEQSMRFTNAYAMPVCSTTRFAALTGRYGRRAGLGAALGRAETWALPTAEHTLAEALSDEGYRTVAIGKWHLAAGEDAPKNPQQSGFDVHDGPLGNSGYFDWERTVNGRTSIESAYTTTVFTDQALRQTTREPWFLWVAYNAAHAETPPPPAALDTRGVNAADDPHTRFLATVEALDSELGRLLNGVPDDTLVIVFGDNGSAAERMRGNWTPLGGKGTVYESGVRVPLWVRHPAGQTGEHEGLVHVVDLLPTVLDWLEIPDEVERDGLSFAEVLSGGEAQRRFVYTERFLDGLDHRSVRGERYKLVEKDGEETFFDLEGRSDDGPPVEVSNEVAAELRTLLF